VLPLHNPALTAVDTSSSGAEGRIRTDTGVAPQQFLRLSRLPFRHFGPLALQLRVAFMTGRCTANLALLSPLIDGAEEQSRTADTRIFSPLLYHLSYLGITGIVGFLQLQCQATVFVIN
jgi:hypothetical protein